MKLLHLNEADREFLTACLNLSYSAIRKLISSDLDEVERCQLMLDFTDARDILKTYKIIGDE